MEESLTLQISGIPLFDDLTVEETDTLEQYLIIKTVPKGSIVYKEGSHGSSVCFVVDGELGIYKTRAGKETEISALSKGESVGEMAIIDGLTRSATVKANTDTTALILKRADFDKLINDNPTIGIKILKGLARLLSINLRKTSDAFTQAMLSVS